MSYSKLLSKIIEDAEKIRAEYQMEFISAPVILVAIAKRCKADYPGIAEYDDLYYPQWFEEDRLRYGFKKLFKGSANITDIYLRSNLKKFYADYDKDFLKDREDAFCKILQNRNKRQISADLVLAEALNCLAPEHRPAVHPAYKEYFDGEAFLQEIDKNVYDYIIDEIGKKVEKLQAKASKAEEIRDWKPAAKFVMPEELKSLIFSSVKLNCTGKTMQIEIPCFFGNQGGLSLELCYAGGVYYVHDNGCSMKILRKNTTEEIFSQVMGKISKNLSIEGGLIIGCFSQIWAFYRYLQNLIFVAHGDLYYLNLDDEGLIADPGITFIDAEKAEVFPEQNFKEELKNSIRVGYDENCGLYVNIDMRYSLNSTSVSYLIETLEQDNIRISDKGKGNVEGEIFESFYWGHDDISDHSDYINKFCERLGAEFDGKDISITSGSDEFVQSLYKFINLAVLLSEFGRIL